MNPLRFLGVARALADMSRDPSTRVGAIVMDDDCDILSSGFNDFPRRVANHPDRYADRATKLKFVVHAESNAIAQAARKGVSLKGGTLLVTSLYPCADCAKQAIQAGIRRVLAPRVNADGTNPQWENERQVASIMFSEAGVEVVPYDAETA